MGKARPTVDLKNNVIGGVLLQVRIPDSEVSDPDSPELIPVWTCDIVPSQVKKMITAMAERVTPDDEVALTHVKRLNKVQNSDNVVIRTILCSHRFLTTKEEVISFLLKNIQGDEENYNIQTLEIPRYLPPTKDAALAWSKEYWPMAWRGNPNHQFLLTVDIDVSAEAIIVNELIELSRTSHKHSVTIICDPHSHKILTIGYDTTNVHPLGHSVMNAIENIANNELERRNGDRDNKDGNMNYLCHDLLVYTTFEPCVMCSMALVHSRIRQLVYLQKIPPTGGIESSYYIGDMEGLNWKFNIWKWIGAEQIDKFNRTIAFDSFNA